MKSDKKPDAIDVKYKPIPKQEDLDPVKTLNTTLYTIGQVATELNVPTYTVRYWTDTYSDYLDIVMCNTHRRYTQLDIEKLKIIKTCLGNKIPHKQIIDTLKNTEFSEEALLGSIEEKQHELNIQVIASTMMSEMESKISSSNEVLLKEVSSYISEQNKFLQDNIIEQVDKMMSDKLITTVHTIRETLQDVNNANMLIDKKLDQIADNISNMQSYENNKRNKSENDIKELIDSIEAQQNEMSRFMDSMENKQNELNKLVDHLDKTNNQHKSWFSRIFGKHK